MITPLQETQGAPIDSESVDVILRDGSTLRLRPPTAGDVDALVRFFAELSDQSLYRRFHGHPAVDARLVASDLDPDWVERGALIGAVATADGERALVAFGPGGVFAELIGDVGFRIAPVTDVDAEELVTTARPGSLSRASGVRRRPTWPRLSISSAAWRGSARITLLLPSST